MFLIEAHNLIVHRFIVQLWEHLLIITFSSLCFQRDYLEATSWLPARESSQPVEELHHMERWETGPEAVPKPEPDQSEESMLIFRCETLAESCVFLFLASIYSTGEGSCEIWVCVSIQRCTVTLGQSFLWCGWEQDPERLLHIWGIQGEIAADPKNIKDFIHPAALFQLIKFQQSSGQQLKKVFFCWFHSRKDQSPKSQSCTTKMPQAPSSFVLNWWAEKSVCVLHVCCFWPPVPQVCYPT